MSEQYNLPFTAAPEPKDPELEMINSLCMQTIQSLKSEAARLNALIDGHIRASDTDSAKELREYVDLVDKAIVIKSKQPQ
jgi:hypothetical protein